MSAIKELSVAAGVLDQVVSAGIGARLVAYPARTAARVPAWFRVEVEHDFTGDLEVLLGIARSTGTRVTVLSGRLMFVDAGDPS